MFAVSFKATAGSSQAPIGSLDVLSSGIDCCATHTYRSARTENVDTGICSRFFIE